MHAPIAQNQGDIAKFQINPSGTNKLFKYRRHIKKRNQYRNVSKTSKHLEYGE